MLFKSTCAPCKTSCTSVSNPTPIALSGGGGLWKTTDLVGAESVSEDSDGM